MSTLTPTSHLRRWLLYFLRVHGFLTLWLAPPSSARSLLLMLRALKGQGRECRAVGARARREAQCCTDLAPHRIATATPQSHHTGHEQ